MRQFLAVLYCIGLFVTLLTESSAALTFSVNGSWPDQARYDAAVAAASSAVDRYNAYGNFNNIQGHVDIYYNAGIPTAQASFGGDIGFGGTWPAERVMMHEMAHFLGLPNWSSGGWNGTGSGMMSGGVWQGTIANQLVQQFDGEGVAVRGDTQHFWPYGLNYDSEGSELNKQRQVAIVYAMRADLGIGPSSHPSSVTSVALTADDPFGTSGFNYMDRWSDGYFAHAGATYSTDDYLLRTPASSSSFTFAGDSLVVNNTDGIDGGLLFKGGGSAAVTTINNLVLDGGYVRHASGAGDLFQLDGSMTLSGSPTIDAAQGNIKLLSPIAGSGTLNLKSAGFTVTLASPSNDYSGATNVQSGTLALSGSTGTGLTTVASGAALVGDGLVRGSLTAESGATIRVGGAGLPIGFSSGHQLLDNFESYATGQIGATPNTTGNVWTGVQDGTSNASIVEGNRNQVLQVLGVNLSSNTWRGAVTSLSSAFDDDSSLPHGDTGTYFFRVRRSGTGTIDTIFGLTDQAASTGTAPGNDIDSPWNEYAVLLSIFGDTNNSQLRAYSDGSGDVNVGSVANAEWLNVWLTVDNSSKTYRVATSTGLDDGVDSGGQYQFGRRTAGTVGSNSLVGFGFHEARGVAAQLDDLYFVDGVNLTNPRTLASTLVGEKLTVDGDLTLGPSSQLFMDIASPTAHDQLVVGGTLMANGSLSVTLDPSGSLVAGDSFGLFHFASATGVFSSFDLPELTAGLSWDTTLLLTNGTLSIVGDTPGDFNDDGIVNLSDYVFWRNHLGAPESVLSPGSSEDGNATVDAGEYATWKANFGVTYNLDSSNSAASAAVPEPRSQWLMVIAVGCSLLLVRRRYWS